MTRAFVFPGQGSQAVGMGRDVAEAFACAREVFEEIDEALGQNLSRLMFEGPDEDLVLTENAQPAIMAVSMAVMQVLKTEGGIDLSATASFVSGHSLGEYSALAAAGCFSITDTAGLLKTRGRAMQEAVPVGQGAMAALMGLDLDDVLAIAADASQDGVCAAANDNAPGQVVVSGDTAAVERAIEIAKEKGAKRAILLPVSAPFHCSLMAPAAEVMAEALAGVAMQPPAVPLFANVSARAESQPDEIRRLLERQVTAMVRWRESVMAMRAAGVETLVEAGAGSVLKSLTRRIDRDLNAVAVGEIEEIETFLQTL